MKTKMLAVMLLAGSAMFAQTRFPFSNGAVGNSRSYNRQTATSYNSGYQVTQQHDQRNYDQHDYAQSNYAQRSSNRESDQGRNRSFENDHNQNRGYYTTVNRFDDDDRVSGRNSRQWNSNSNEFRNR